jgi:hypothetical protein
MTTRVARVLLVLTLVSSGPADARKWARFDGSIVISDEPVADAFPGSRRLGCAES